MSDKYKEKPSFYAIIPASVRYDSKLTPNAKLLYGEISALTSSTNVCWASNGYFANLYNVELRSIQNWMSTLVKQNHIEINFERISEMTMETRRQIRLKDGGISTYKKKSKAPKPTEDISAKETPRFILSDESNFFKETLLERLKKKYSEDSSWPLYSTRFKNLIEDACTKQKIKINNVDVTIENWLKTMMYYFKDSMGETIAETFTIVDTKQGVKNRFAYTVATLYNVARLDGYEV